MLYSWCKIRFLSLLFCLAKLSSKFFSLSFVVEKESIILGVVGMLEFYLHKFRYLFKISYSDSFKFLSFNCYLAIFPAVPNNWRLFSLFSIYFSFFKFILIVFWGVSTFLRVGFWYFGIFFPKFSSSKNFFTFSLFCSVLYYICDVVEFKALK